MRKLVNKTAALGKAVVCKLVGLARKVAESKAARYIKTRILKTAEAVEKFVDSNPVVKKVVDFVMTNRTFQKCVLGGICLVAHIFSVKHYLKNLKGTSAKDIVWLCVRCAVDFYGWLITYLKFMHPTIANTYAAVMYGWAEAVGRSVGASVARLRGKVRDILEHAKSAPEGAEGLSEAM